jgi:hypothetical protein
VLSFWGKKKIIPHFPCWVIEEFWSPSDGVGVQWQSKFFGYHQIMGVYGIAKRKFGCHLPFPMDGEQNGFGCCH